MATASMSNILECSICRDTFKDQRTPKVLQCGHTFCVCCLERCIADKREIFPCPFCKKVIKIPEGGAKEFTTNYIVKNYQPPSTTQPKCPNHNQREVDYYCNNCNVGLCSKCILGQHKEHETLDIECDETRSEAIEKLQRSKEIIQNRIKNLKKNRSTLLESFEQLKSFSEDSCAKMTEETEQIVSDLRKSCENKIKDIRKNLDENRRKIEDREKEITSDINVLESTMESIISPSTETTLNILSTLSCLKEIEKLGETRDEYDLCIQYLQWVGNDFSLDIDQLGSIESYYIMYIPGWYQFICNVSDVKEKEKYYCIKKFRYNHLVWSCSIFRADTTLYICIVLLPEDNPKLDYLIIDYQLNILNYDDDSKIITSTICNKRVDSSGSVSFHTTWSNLTDKDNGYLNCNGQFVVQFDITQTREISWK